MTGLWTGVLLLLLAALAATVWIWVRWERARSRDELRQALATSLRIDAIAQEARVQMLGEVMRHRWRRGHGVGCPVCGRPRS